MSQSSDLAGPLFHGGVRRLHKGSVLLPPSRSGSWSCADYGAAHACRRDRVYVTTELDQARLFALMAPPHGCGDLYEVEPLGALEVDSDYLGPGASYSVPMARVVRVIERHVSEVQGLGPQEAAALLGSDGDLFPAGARLVVRRAA